MGICAYMMLRWIKRGHAFVPACFLCVWSIVLQMMLTKQFVFLELAAFLPPSVLSNMFFSSHENVFSAKSNMGSVFFLTGSFLRPDPFWHHCLTIEALYLLEDKLSTTEAISLLVCLKRRVKAKSHGYKSLSCRCCCCWDFVALLFRLCS